MATKARFTLILLLTYALCALVVSTAVAIGRGLPPDNQPMLLLPRSCALPCIFGITPGETHRAQAVEGIAGTAEFPVDQLGGALSFQITDDQGNLINGLIISDEDSIVQYARLYTRRWAGLGIRLGDLMQADRMHPTQVYRSCSGTFPVRLLLTFEGDPQVGFAAIIADSVSPFAPITLIDVTTSDEFFVQTLATVFGNGCYIPSEWRGFGRTWLYATQPLFSPF